MAFTSQTFAVASMTCDMEKTLSTTQTTASSNQSHAHSMSNMEHHDMSAMMKMEHENPIGATHQSFDCCKTMGHCLFSNCSFAATEANLLMVFAKRNSAAIDFYSSNSPTPLLSSLFRPPILA